MWADRPTVPSLAGSPTMRKQPWPTPPVLKEAQTPSFFSVCPILPPPYIPQATSGSQTSYGAPCPLGLQRPPPSWLGLSMGRSSSPGTFLELGEHLCKLRPGQACSSRPSSRGRASRCQAEATSVCSQGAREDCWLLSSPASWAEFCGTSDFFIW